MNREWKIVLIVFGSLFALLVVAAACIIVLGSKMANTIVSEQNPQAMAATAAKVAHFTIPRGYRIVAASDFGLQQTVTLAPDRSERRGFTLQLQSSRLGSDPKSTAEGMSIALGLAAKIVRCTPHSEIDRIALHDRTIELTALACDGGTRPLRIETGVIPRSPNAVTVVATGLDGAFDRDALVALLRSIR